ncbi:MAG: tetratricopeptide repeat protein, partial [Alphaproteobacteria bacterium]|nr:tetratricopeptide repeat protein [Alphaproteobacteria bacterium]
MSGPADPRAILGNAVRLLQSGRAADAEELLEALLRADPQNADALGLLGLVHAQRGDNLRAEDFMSRALALNPHHAATHVNRANVLRKLERTSDAAQAYASALALRPDHMEARKNHGLVLAELGRHGEALAELDLVAGPSANHPQLLARRAQLRYRAQRPLDAVADYDVLVALDPTNWEAFNNRGIALDMLQRYNEALQSYDQALALKPNDDNILHNRGATLICLLRYAEALPLFERLTQSDPSLADNWSCHGVALASLGRLEEAIASFDRALSLDADTFRAHNGKGMALTALGRTQDALVEYRAALSGQPGNAMTHGNMAFALLVAGDLARGFEEYEWRRRDGPIGQSQRTYPQSEWQGEPLAGKTLFLHPEQGFGDTIQFARFAPLLKAQGARVILEVQAGLENLCRSLGPDITVLGPGQPLPEFDLHAPLMSVAHKLRIALETIPANVPYLHAGDDARLLWRERLSALKHPRVGLCWSGSLSHRNDQSRSIALADLSALLATPDISFVSLQREVRPTDASFLATLPNVAQLMHHVADFADTAALIAELDLVITVDTSVAHVAGAIGKPVWILIASAPDWRWLQ